MTSLANKVRSTFQYYRRNGYYRFIGTNVLKITFTYALVMIAVLLIARYVINPGQLYQGFIYDFADEQVLILFFVSESLLGMIPPDLFMLWAEKFDNPLPMLTLLGVLSYLGGIISYGIGIWISKRAKVKKYIELRLSKYIALTQRWGGAFLVIAALFPFSPYAMVVLAVSILKYPFYKLLIYGLSRVVRFVLQGTALIKLLELNF